MSFWRNLIVASCAAVVAAGCVTREDRLKLDVPAEQKAVVYGIVENKVMTGVERALSFTAIDGVSTYRGYGKGYPVTVELLPGRHTLTVLYRITEQGQAGPAGEFTKELEVRPGRTYRTLLEEDDGRWDVSFHELSEAEMRAEEQRRAERRAAQMDV
jgi:hypothetical protein